jgi:hypothetical protein
MVLACGACTLLLDRNATQCHSDADCTKLGGFLPVCVSGACLESHLGPAPSCFNGAPSSRTDFLNHCSTGFLPPEQDGGACLSFDDCARLGVCANVDPPPAIAPPSPDAGTTSTADAGTAADAPSPGSPNLPRCADQANGTAGIVYITGSSNFPNVLQKMAPLLYKAPPPLAPGPTPVFLTTNSCTSAKSVFSSRPADQVLHDPPPGSPAAKYAHYFDKAGTMLPCSLGSGVAVDIGESDVYSTTCDPSYVASAAIPDHLGPIQAMVFVVPKLSPEQTISHEAAREVFGLGGNDAGASPWTNPLLYFVRNKNTGTQQMIGLEIGVDPAAFWGIDQGSADNVHYGLVGVTDPSEVKQAIGIIAVDVYDSDRDNLKALAYQDQDQECAYLPDSTATSKDKRNVRDGHYPIWGPLHFFTNQYATVTNAPLTFLAYWTSAQTPELMDAFIAASLVPPCAMAVQREQGKELGALAPISPRQQSCSCYFESRTGTAAPECTACSGDDDCPATRVCARGGFCEIRPSL